MTKATGDRIASAALAQIGTPYAQDGRLAGVALDCVGLVLHAYREAGEELPDYPGYNDGNDHLEVFRAAMRDRFREVMKGEPPEPGDVLLFRGKGMTSHCGIFLAEGRVCHAWGKRTVEKVVAHDLEDWWGRRLLATYRLKGLG